MAKLILEFMALFVVVPTAFRLVRWNLHPLPVLWAVAVYCAVALRALPAWNPAPLPRALPSILLIFCCVAATMLAIMVIRKRLPVFLLPRTQPQTWLLILISYPLLSVCPQAFIYRAFFFARYQPLFPNTYVMIVVSATAFAFMHLVFRNWLAVALTFVGGLLFAWRYQQTGSLLASAFEHALYGCWIFTVGLGGYLYHGTYRLAQKPVPIVDQV